MQLNVTQPNTSAPRSNYKWWVVGMLWWVCFFNYADRQSIFSIFPLLGEEFHLDKTDLGFVGSAFMWVYAFAAPVAGFVGDRLRRKDLILGGCLFWSFITMMTSWCGKFWQFITVRALGGLGESVYFPAAMSLISDYHGKATRSKAMGLHQSSVYIGTIAGGWLGAWFAVHFGWRMGFYFFGAAGMVLALMLFKFLREPKRGAADASDAANAADAPACGHGAAMAAPLSIAETTKAIFRAPTAVLLMLVFLGVNSVATIFLTWTPTFLVEKFHFELTSAGLSGSVFINLASALSVPLGGMLADRFVRKLAGGRMLVQMLGLLAGSVFVFMVGTTFDVATLLIAMSCFGFCKGFYDSNIFASLYDVIEPRARGSAAGLMNTVGWGGGAMGPVIVGWLAQHGRHATEMENMSEAIAWCGAIYLVGAALLLVAIGIFARRDVERCRALVS